MTTLFSQSPTSRNRACQRSSLDPPMSSLLINWLNTSGQTRKVSQMRKLQTESNNMVGMSSKVAEGRASSAS